jgi:hypothetical protein
MKCIRGTTLNLLCGRTFRAFTLLEMVFAAALSAVLIVGVLLVIGAVTRDRARLERDAYPVANRDDSVVELLRSDLLNTQTIAVPDPTRVVLTGYAAIEDGANMPPGRLSQITWHLESDGSINGLYRTQQALDDLTTPSPPTTLLIATGVKSIRLQPLFHEDSKRNAPAAPRPKIKPFTAAAASMPEGVQLTMGWADDSKDARAGAAPIWLR